MKYLLSACGVLLLVFFMAKCKHWLRLRWSKMNYKEEKIIIIVRIQNLEIQIEGLIRELLAWRRYFMPNMELVIIDNDSTDASKAILERLNGSEQKYHLLSSQCYELCGLTSLDCKISEMVVIELSSEADYISNLHKLKKILLNIEPKNSDYGQELLS